MQMDPTPPVVHQGRRPWPRAVRGLLTLWVLISLAACAGLYPALYTRPESPGQGIASEQTPESPDIAPNVPISPTPGVGPGITVATLNMLHGLPRFEYLEPRRALILAELERLSPDVILLQEVPVFRSRSEQIGPWLAESLGYNLAYGRAGCIGFEEGEAVLSRYPILEAQRQVLRPRPGLFENRIVLRAVIDTPLGTLEVYNTHFSHRVNRDPLRMKQAVDLIGFLRNTYTFRELPAVVGGDITDPTDGPKARIDYLFLYAEGAEKQVIIRRCARFLDRPFRARPFPRRPAGCGPATTWGCYASWPQSDAEAPRRKPQDEQLGPPARIPATKMMLHRLEQSDCSDI